MPAAVLTNSEGAPGVQAAADALSAGSSPLDAVEAGVRIVESDPSIRSVGFGGAPNLLGEMECDASIMCGATLRTGAVGAVKNYLHVISIARQVMERLPHVMLVAEGAERFAAEVGQPQSNMLSGEARSKYEAWLNENLPGPIRTRWPDVPLSDHVWPPESRRPSGGTTAFLVRAGDGNFAGGASTSGWAYKYPGRIGDSPLIGAGLYVDNRYGAAACTHTGEMAIRAGTARAVIAYVRKGAALAEACLEALEDLRSLKGGYLGPLILHALDRDGEPCVLATGLKKPARYWFWREGMGRPEQRAVISG